VILRLCNLSDVVIGGMAEDLLDQLSSGQSFLTRRDLSVLRNGQ